MESKDFTIQQQSLMFIKIQNQFIVPNLVEVVGIADKIVQDFVLSCSASFYRPDKMMPPKPQKVPSIANTFTRKNKKTTARVVFYFSGGGGDSLVTLCFS
jgi:hypothetical protein